jgi:hypothetical protein
MLNSYPSLFWCRYEGSKEDSEIQDAAARPKLTCWSARQRCVRIAALRIPVADTALLQGLSPLVDSCQSIFGCENVKAIKAKFDSNSSAEVQEDMSLNSTSYILACEKPQHMSKQHANMHPHCTPELIRRCVMILAPDLRHACRLLSYGAVLQGGQRPAVRDREGSPRSCPCILRPPAVPARVNHGL